MSGEAVRQTDEGLLRDKVTSVVRLMKNRQSINDLFSSYAECLAEGSPNQWLTHLSGSVSNLVRHAFSSSKAQVRLLLRTKSEHGRSGVAIANHVIDICSLIEED